MRDSNNTDEIDVVTFSPASPLPPPPPPTMTTAATVSSEEGDADLNDDEKKYYCQRCLNHGLYFPRKGHKPKCRHLNCTCQLCFMVERRRQLNSLLSRKIKMKKAEESSRGDGSTSSPSDVHQSATGSKVRRVRDPKCARCGAHGVKHPLRGHKKSECPFLSCRCQMCDLVEHRRQLMAKQIKLRRDQQKDRGGCGVVIGAKSKPKPIVLREHPNSVDDANTMTPSSSIGDPASPSSSMMFTPIATPPATSTTSILMMPTATATTAPTTPMFSATPAAAVATLQLLAFGFGLPPPPPPPPMTSTINLELMLHYLRNSQQQF